MGTDDNNRPQITVLLPAYNAEHTIAATIESVLAQTFEDFELLIINDGSTDGTAEIIDGFSDLRIRLVHNDGNRGLIYTLNRGIELSRGRYIARMDADDEMAPERLQKQFELLESRPEIDLCSTFITIFNESGVIGKQNYGVSNNEIRAEMLFNSPLCHPAVMIRSEVFKQYQFDAGFKYCEDYELFARMLMRHQAENIPHRLLKYRVSETSETSKGESHTEERYENLTRIHSQILSTGFGIENDEAHKRLHYALSLTERIAEMKVDRETVRKVSNYFKRLQSANRDRHFCAHSALNKSLGKIWIKLLIHHGKKQPKALAFSRFTFHGIRYIFSTIGQG